MSIAVGDVVKKKSGGPKMDVEAAEGDAFRCSWIDASGQYQWELLLAATLKKVEERTGPRPTSYLPEGRRRLRG